MSSNSLTCRPHEEHCTIVGGGSHYCYDYWYYKVHPNVTLQFDIAIFIQKPFYGCENNPPNVEPSATLMQKYSSSE